MDKLVADGRRVTISNDGATIMRLLEIEHPAAKTLVDISMSQVRMLYYLSCFESIFCLSSSKHTIPCHPHNNHTNT